MGPSMTGAPPTPPRPPTLSCPQWNNHVLELDETKYDWGTLYELECETVGGWVGA